MVLSIIKTVKQYQDLLEWIDIQFDFDFSPESKEWQQLQSAILLIKQYEDKYHRIPSPYLIEIIKLKMEEKGFVNKDLVAWIRSETYVSELLNCEKPLTLVMMKVLHKKLGIPMSVLLA